MTFQEKISLDDDPLKPLRTWTTDIFNTVIGKVVIFAWLIVVSILVLVQTCYFLYNFDSNILFINLSAYLTEIYVMVCICFNLQFTRYFYDHFEQCPKWQTNVNEIAFERKMTQQSLRTLKFCFGLFAFSITCGVVFSIPTECDYKLPFLFYVWIQNISSDPIRSLFLICFRASIIVAFPIMLMPYIETVYALQHQRFRIHFLLDHLENIDVDSRNCEESVFSKKYHQNIRQRLTYCIRRHVEILRLAKEIGQRSRIFVLLFIVVGSLVIVSIFMFLLVVRDLDLLIYIRLTLFVTFAITVSIRYAIEGQKTEDAYEDMFRVLNTLDWYHWNNDNQKMFLKFLTIATKEVKIKYSTKLACNYESTADIFKAIYSMCCVLYRVL